MLLQSCDAHCPGAEPRRWTRCSLNVSRCRKHNEDLNFTSSVTFEDKNSLRKTVWPLQPVGRRFYLQILSIMIMQAQFLIFTVVSGNGKFQGRIRMKPNNLDILLQITLQAIAVTVHTRGGALHSYIYPNLKARSPFLSV